MYLPEEMTTAKIVVFFSFFIPCYSPTAMRVVFKLQNESSQHTVSLTLSREKQHHTVYVHCQN
jgi:hypothetical protein